jgi:hypothetical protein
MTSIGEPTLSRARITRARANISEFAEVLSQYLDRRPAEVIVDINEQGQGTIRVDHREPIPVQLPILLGEALQNLRAGLKQETATTSVTPPDHGRSPDSAIPS